MDWFERITGFQERNYRDTQSKLSVDGEFLVSKVTGVRHRIGELELVELGTLRQRRAQGAGPGARTTVRGEVGDARALHAQPAFAQATFQVASQFNLLEMVGPEVTPEEGVTRYSADRTQGPACAIAAGAGTIFRNYLVPLDGHQGQTAARQIDALAPLGRALSARLGQPVHELWAMRNGYALCTREGLDAIASLLERAGEDERDAWRACLAVGVHRDVAVTDVKSDTPPVVTQVYCSALPVAYGRTAAPAWEPFARLVLEAAYEATLMAAVEQKRRGGSAIALLTRLGGGAFGNPDHWIDDAIVRGLTAVADAGLDVRLVSYGAAHAGNRRIEAAWRVRGSESGSG